MDLDRLFDALRVEATATGRDRLVAQAVEEGVDLSELRDMLDYLDLHLKSRKTQQSASVPQVLFGHKMQPSNR